MAEFDIFISYRRVGGFETAKHLYDLLRHEGYSVSFDIDTLREGKFNVALLSRIKKCQDFVLIVDPHTFDRTLDPNFDPEQDWLRQELAYALSLQKNVIPILLAGASFPDGLPDDIREVKFMNGPGYSKDYFDSFYSKLKSFLNCKPRTNTPAILELSGTGNYETIKENAKERVLLPVMSSSEKLYGYATSSGQVIIPPIYSCALDFVNGQAIVKSGKKWGIIDADNRVITPFIFDDIDYPHAGLYSVKKDGLYGIIDRSGNIKVPCIYSWLQVTLESIMVKDGDKYGFINSNGVPIVPCIYDDVHFFREGLAWVKRNGKWGAVNKKGEIAISFSYDEWKYEQSGRVDSYSFIEGWALVCTDKETDKWNLINKDGDLLLNIPVDDCYAFSENLARIIKNKRYGFVNRLGEVIIPLEYSHATYFSEGLAGVEKNGKWGYIDKSGQMVIPFCGYDEVGPFGGGLAAVVKGDKVGFINRKGTMVCGFNYDNRGGIFAYGHEHKNGVIPVCKNGLWGALSTHGYEVVACEYKDVPYFNDDGYALFTKPDGTKCYFNIFGQYSSYYI